MQIVDVESITKDECIAFGQYISAQLKKLDQKTFAIVKYKISEVLYNAEMGNFSEMWFCIHIFLILILKIRFENYSFLIKLIILNAGIHDDW